MRSGSSPKNRGKLSKPTRPLLMVYQTDYVMRLIEQLGSLIKRALEKSNEGDAEETYVLAREALGLALDIDPELADRLSPESLASLVGFGDADPRVLELAGQALDLQALALESDGDFREAQLRRDQAAAIRALSDPRHVN